MEQHAWKVSMVTHTPGPPPALCLMWSGLLLFRAADVRREAWECCSNCTFNYCLLSSFGKFHHASSAVHATQLMHVWFTSTLHFWNFILTLVTLELHMFRINRKTSSLVLVFPVVTLYRTYLPFPRQARVRFHFPFDSACVSEWENSSSVLLECCIV